MFQQLSATWNKVPGMVPLAVPKQYTKMENQLMTIRNECLTSHAFRKVHIEHATYGDLDIVHHVAFPHYVYDMPVLGVDVVHRRGIPTMAIADVSGDCSFTYAIVEIQEKHGMRFQKRRPLPAWGLEIFSPRCVFLDSPDPELFKAYVADVVDVYIHFASCQCPNPSVLMTRKDEQIRYCTHQLRNTRTRNVLQKAFGTTLADGYMRDVMFSW